MDRNRRSYKKKLLAGVLILLAGILTWSGFTTLRLKAANIPASFFTTNPFFIINDAQGANDVPGQKDLTRMGRWDHDGYLDVFWSWDEIQPKSSSFDACALFASTSSGNPTYAICAEVINKGDNQNNPSPRLNTAGFPVFYKCDGTLPLNCGGASAQTTPASLQMGDLMTLDPTKDLITDTDPFGSNVPLGPGNAYPYDTTVRMKILKTDLPGELINVCTYESASPTSSAGDCLANPGGGFLKVVKNTTGGDGTFTFDVSPVPSSNAGGPCNPNVAGCVAYQIQTQNLTGNVGVSLGINQSSVTVTEEDPAPAFSFTNTSCQYENDGPTGTLNTSTRSMSGIGIQVGVVTVCTFTNAKQPAHITVTKVVVNDNGGTASVPNFTLKVGDNAVTSGVTADVADGTYTITESGPSGYTASFSGDCDANGNITMKPGQLYSCTITNNDKPPSLTLSKIVTTDNGGSASSGAWTLSASGPTPISGPGGASSGPNFKAGTYTLSESGGPSGYAPSSWSGSQNGNQITLAVERSAVCTITNDDIQPQLIVKKIVNNTNGGTKGSPDFTINVTGNAAAPSSFPGSASGTTVAVNAGAYSVSETPVSGYAAAYSGDCTGSIAVGQTKTCTVTNQDQAGTLTIIKHVINDNRGIASAGDFTMVVNGTSPSNTNFPGSEKGVQILIGAGNYSVDESGSPSLISAYSKTLGAGCSGVMANGGSATCVITNDDIAPQLTVVKQVVNTHGGTAQPSAFSGSISGTAGSSTWSGGSTTVTLATAGSYSVTESPVTGYTASYSADCNGSISIGQTKTCTVTNQDKAGTLTVIKHVVNDFGATGTADQFTMVVTAGHPSKTNFAGSEDGVQVEIDAGNYSVNETGGPVNYTKSLGAGCSGTMTNGGSATCTITNSATAPKLTIVKQVVNDNGGTAIPSAFSGAVSGTAGSGSWSGSSTTITMGAGTYSVTENEAAGYTASYSNGCSGSISSGNDQTCTITNNDIAPILTLVKLVNTAGINDPALPPSAFTTRTTGGPTNISGQGGVVSGATFKAGTYTLSESGPSGFTPGAWSCAGQGTQVGSTITLGIAQTAICTILNTLNNIPPSVKIDKTATPHNLDSSGSTVTFTVTVTNMSGSYDPFTITSLTDTVYGDLTNSSDAKAQNDNTCADAVGKVIPGGGTYTCTWTSYFPPLPTNQTLSEHDVATVVGQDDDNAGPSSIGTASDDATVTQASPIVITDGNCEMNLFRRIYTQDAAYHYTSTNSGQFFYNMAISGVPGTKRHVTLQLPWPFVTQGSQPIHVYDSVDWMNHCFSNYGSGGYSIDNYVQLMDYGVAYPTVKTGYLPSLLTRTVELEITIPDTGFAFIRQHLDDGIKGWGVDFNGDGIIDTIDYGVDSASNATDSATGQILVPELFDHPFYMWGFKCSVEDPACDITPPSSDLAIEGGTSIKNDNDFQKYVGVRGTVMYNAVPVPGMTVQLKSGSTLMGAAITDSNGMYSIAYKNTSGKEKFTVTLVNPTGNANVLSGGGTISGQPGSTTKTVNLKPNGTATVNFPLVP